MCKRANLTNRKFGRLTVVEFVDSNKGNAMWKCQCECGNVSMVRADKLKSGVTRSCGCLRRDMQTPNTNEYDLTGDFGVGYTLNSHSAFYFDKEDYDLIKPFHWREDIDGYAQAQTHGKHIFLHRLVLSNIGDAVVDHINHNKLDNRKCNLRECTIQQNSWNRRCHNNVCGYKGVKSNGYGKFVAQITKDHVSFYLGTYVTAKDAAIAYNQKAIELFGEFACLNDILPCD